MLVSRSYWPNQTSTYKSICPCMHSPCKAILPTGCDSRPLSLFAMSRDKIRRMAPFFELEPATRPPPAGNFHHVIGKPRLWSTSTEVVRSWASVLVPTVPSVPFVLPYFRASVLPHRKERISRDDEGVRNIRRNRHNSPTIALGEHRP